MRDASSEAVRRAGRREALRSTRSTFPNLLFKGLLFGFERPSSSRFFETWLDAGGWLTAPGGARLRAYSSVG